jgi:small subunit ribosomal protein S17
MEETLKRGVRRTMDGTVVSDRRDKTIAVAVTERIRHKAYGKIITRTKKFHAHDENNEAHVGDKVRICECRPYSRQKRWRLVDVVSKSVRGDAA